MLDMPKSVVPMSFRNLRAAHAKASKVFGMFLLAALAMSGLGAVAQLPGLTMSNSGTLTLPSGAFGAVTVTLTPVGGFSGTVVVACTNLPQYAYCQYPNLNQEVTVGGSATTINITVETSQVNNYQAKSVSPRHGLGGIAAAALLAPAGLLLFAFRRKSLKSMAAIRAVLGVVVLASIAGLSGCGSTKPLTTPPGTYTIPITATLNRVVNASTSLTLVVQ